MAEWLAGVGVVWLLNAARCCPQQPNPAQSQPLSLAAACPQCKGDCASCSTDLEGREQCDWCKEGFQFDDEDSPDRRCVPVAE
jgi:hypothetical protein